MEFSLLNDEPVMEPGEDRLGTERAAHELAKLLYDSRAATPFTLAVDAGWGMGKSTLMRLVDAELRKKYDVPTLWYNAWTSTGADALEGLIKSVLAKFDTRLLRRAAQRVSEQRAVIGVARAALTLLAGPLGAAGLVDRLWRDLSVDAQSRNAMRDELRKLATQWAESTPYEPRKMLVVFVDDLDRCSEETILAVCEAVKVYLDVPGLAFVVGCDRSALGPSGLLRDLSPAGSAFMEKIFQTSYRVPVPGVDKVKEYVGHCAERSGIQDLLTESLVDLIAAHSSRNPRRIKRLINGFGLESALNLVWKGFSSGTVIRVLLLQQLYPDFYRTLLAREGADVHAIHEFLRYRTARQVLSRPSVRPADGTWEAAANCLAAYDLDAPDRELPGVWGTRLAELEGYVPTGFPELARDQNFVALVDELVVLAELDDLVERLQQGVPGVAAARSEEPPAAGTSGSAAPSYAGKHVLWIDDHPDGNAAFVERLESQGAKVWPATDRERAEHVLGVTRIDLLISDVQRGLDRDAGITDLQDWRDRDRYKGPAVFFTSRITPNREARSRELGAWVATSPPMLFQYIGAALEPADP
ncbi:P-loop NTPase fold protein [Streptomyces sp. R41]|uniref:P-loop NTPase fold protein n=1 Tax=Streptomyces sp. R41 TaxID=3238632 RepID=A0AB39RMM3_9ACTN